MDARKDDDDEESRQGSEMKGNGKYKVDEIKHCHDKLSPHDESLYILFVL